jgi:hypothetical protein
MEGQRKMKGEAEHPGMIHDWNLWGRGKRMPDSGVGLQIYIYSVNGWNLHKLMISHVWHYCLRKNTVSIAFKLRALKKGQGFHALSE